LWTPATGARAVHGAILAHFENHGREEMFGYQLADEEAHGADGRKQRFEMKTLYWTPARGVWLESGHATPPPCRRWGSGSAAVLDLGYARPYVTCNDRRRHANPAQPKSPPPPRGPAGSRDEAGADLGSRYQARRLRRRVPAPEQGRGCRGCRGSRPG